MWPLPQAQRAIVIAGSLAMAYTQLTTSPATVQFARSLGATSLHVGILGALPIGLVVMQLSATLVAHRLESRKRFWMMMSLAQRMVLLPAALGPWLIDGVPDAVWIWLLIALTTLNHGMLHFVAPLWLSWMGDYLPHQGLNRFWGHRHSAQQWTAAVALLANALFFFHSGIDVRAAFAAIIALGSLLGVIDVLLFLRIEEPPIRRGPQVRLRDALAGPLREPNFRSFIWFSCIWHLSAMVGAPFISMFLLEHVGMDLFHVLLLWTGSWVGGALLSHRLGACAERWGQRPVLVLCTAFKSINMIALLFCPRDSVAAFWLLLPVFMIDAFLNAGIAIANNGFMIKNSPRESRTAFIAAGTGFAGLVGGATSILAGALLSWTDNWRGQLGGMELVNFHVLFAVSVLLRLAAAVVAVQVREPASWAAREVIRDLALATRVRLRQVTIIGWRRDELEIELTDAEADAPRKRRAA